MNGLWGGSARRCGNQFIREDEPDKVNIDVGGLGIGVYDRLLEMGHRRSVVNPVNFGGKPIEPSPVDEPGKPGGGPANRRAEMWSNIKRAREGSLGTLDYRAPGNIRRRWA